MFAASRRAEGRLDTFRAECCRSDDRGERIRIPKRLPGENRRSGYFFSDFK